MDHLLSYKEVVYSQSSTCVCIILYKVLNVTEVKETMWDIDFNGMFICLIITGIVVGIVSWGLLCWLFSHISLTWR